MMIIWLDLLLFDRIKMYKYTIIFKTIYIYVLNIKKMTQTRTLSGFKAMIKTKFYKNEV